MFKEKETKLVDRCFHNRRRIGSIFEEQRNDIVNEREDFHLNSILNKILIEEIVEENI
jgi:hypothetical protein